MSNEILDRLSDFDIISNLEEALSERNLDLRLDSFEADVERDNTGIKVILRVGTTVDSSGEKEFEKNPELRTIVTEFPEGKVYYDLQEIVPVSGMELEAVYRPRSVKKNVKK